MTTAGIYRPTPRWRRLWLSGAGTTLLDAILSHVAAPWWICRSPLGGGSPRSASNAASVPKAPHSAS
ncbi:hypothetical protein DPMN_174133 [Dreissena polymorpha]|uniref:Uncharacterized protein n=1 Tax=Dreissena polymorpha TaxID=45954 RepID=A0A9D4E6W8_DREPO|nr:hypothetical protein DPMN_174133 [Dreissena polymorpha]